MSQNLLMSKGVRLGNQENQDIQIGGLIWVSPCTSAFYYLRMMLTVVKGAICFEDIRTVSDIQYSTFRDACFAMDLLQDDRKYIEALKETYDWGSGFYRRKLFTKYGKKLGNDNVTKFFTIKETYLIIKRGERREHSQGLGALILVQELEKR
ncbi:hypothetical protein Lal_00012537 [Lupinus albus]|nr:hypothetical protein Lal_00012537 [Lupinus albus]